MVQFKKFNIINQEMFIASQCIYASRDSKLKKVLMLKIAWRNGAPHFEDYIFRSYEVVVAVVDT